MLDTNKVAMSNMPVAVVATKPDSQRFQPAAVVAANEAAVARLKPNGLSQGSTRLSNKPINRTAITSTAFSQVGRCNNGVVSEFRRAEVRFA